MNPKISNIWDIGEHRRAIAAGRGHVWQIKRGTLRNVDIIRLQKHYVQFFGQSIGVAWALFAYLAQKANKPLSLWAWFLKWGIIFLFLNSLMANTYALDEEFIKERYDIHGLIPEGVEYGNNVSCFYRRMLPGELEQIEMLLSKLAQFHSLLVLKSSDRQKELTETALKLTIIDSLYRLLAREPQVPDELKDLQATLAQVRKQYPSITQRPASYQELSWKHAMKQALEDAPVSVGALECYCLALLKALMNPSDNMLEQMERYGNLIDKFYYIHIVEAPCQAMLEQVQPIAQDYSNRGNFKRSNTPKAVEGSARMQASESSRNYMLQSPYAILPRFRALQSLIDQYVAPKYFGYNVLFEDIPIQQSSGPKLYEYTEINRTIAYQAIHWLTIRTFIESYLQNPAGDKDLSTCISEFALYLEEALTAIIHLTDDNGFKRIPSLPLKTAKLIQKDLIYLSAEQLRADLNSLEGENFRALPASVQQKTVLDMLFRVGEHAKMQRAWGFNADFNTPLGKIRDKVVLHFNRKGYPKQLNVLNLVRQTMVDEDLQAIINALKSVGLDDKGFLSIGNDHLNALRELFFIRVKQMCSINNPIKDRLIEIQQAYRDLYTEVENGRKDLLVKKAKVVDDLCQTHANLGKHKQLLRTLINAFDPGQDSIQGVFWEVFWGQVLNKKLQGPLNALCQKAIQERKKSTLNEVELCADLSEIIDKILSEAKKTLKEFLDISVIDLLLREIKTQWINAIVDHLKNKPGYVPFKEKLVELCNDECSVLSTSTILNDAQTACEDSWVNFGIATEFPEEEIPRLFTTLIERQDKSNLFEVANQISNLKDLVDNIAAGKFSDSLLNRLREAEALPAALQEEIGQAAVIASFADDTLEKRLIVLEYWCTKIVELMSDLQSILESQGLEEPFTVTSIVDLLRQEPALEAALMYSVSIIRSMLEVIKDHLFILYSWADVVEDPSQKASIIKLCKELEEDIHARFAFASLYFHNHTLRSSAFIEEALQGVWVRNAMNKLMVSGVTSFSGAFAQGLEFLGGIFMPLIDIADHAIELAKPFIEKLRPNWEIDEDWSKSIKEGRCMVEGLLNSSSNMSMICGTKVLNLSELQSIISQAFQSQQILIKFAQLALDMLCHASPLELRERTKEAAANYIALALDESTTQIERNTAADKLTFLLEDCLPASKALENLDSSAYKASLESLLGLFMGGRPRDYFAGALAEAFPQKSIENGMKLLSSHIFPRDSEDPLYTDEQDGKYNRWTVLASLVHETLMSFSHGSKIDALITHASLSKTSLEQYLAMVRDFQAYLQKSELKANSWKTEILKNLDENPIAVINALISGEVQLSGLSDSNDGQTFENPYIDRIYNLIQKRSQLLEQELEFKDSLQMLGLSGPERDEHLKALQEKFQPFIQHAFQEYFSEKEIPFVAEALKRLYGGLEANQAEEVSILRTNLTASLSYEEIIESILAEDAFYSSKHRAFQKADTENVKALLQDFFTSAKNYEPNRPTGGSFQLPGYGLHDEIYLDAANLECGFLGLQFTSRGEARDALWGARTDLRVRELMVNTIYDELNGGPNQWTNEMREALRWQQVDYIDDLIRENIKLGEGLLEGDITQWGAVVPSSPLWNWLASERVYKAFIEGYFARPLAAMPLHRTAPGQASVHGMIDALAALRGLHVHVWIEQEAGQPLIQIHQTQAPQTDLHQQVREIHLRFIGGIGIGHFNRLEPSAVSANANFIQNIINNRDDDKNGPSRGIDFHSFGSSSNGKLNDSNSNESSHTRSSNSSANMNNPSGMNTFAQTSFCFEPGNLLDEKLTNQYQHYLQTGQFFQTLEEYFRTNRYNGYEIVNNAVNIPLMVNMFLGTYIFQKSNLQI